MDGMTAVAMAPADPVLAGLRPYQREDVQWMAAERAVLYVADPGLGKSAVALRAARRAGAQRVLVIGPAVSRASWPVEHAKWGVPLSRFIHWSALRFPRKVPAGPLVLFVTWGELAGARSELTQAGRWDALVVDEGHYAKDKGAQRTRALYGRKIDRKGGLVEACERVWVLTGTPAPNNYGEVWTHIHALRPDLLPAKLGATKPMSFTQFLHTVCIVKDTAFGQQVVGARKGMGTWLRGLLSQSGFMRRRRKVDVAQDLPAMSWVDVPLHIPAARSASSLAQVAAEVSGKEDWFLAVRGIADGLQAAEQLVEGDAFLHASQADTAVSSARRALGLAKAEPAVAWIKDLLDSGCPKVVVFAVHRDVIAAIVSCLAAYNVVTVTGETSGSDRARAVAEFQDGPARVFVGQVQAAGTAITLTAASDVVFVEQSWTPADNFQAACRAHRLGQTNSVVVRVLHAAGTLDERVSTVLRRKAAAIAEAFG